MLQILPYRNRSAVERGIRPLAPRQRKTSPNFRCRCQGQPFAKGEIEGARKLLRSTGKVLFCRSCSTQALGFAYEEMDKTLFLNKKQKNSPNLQSRLKKLPLWNAYPPAEPPHHLATMTLSVLSSASRYCNGYDQSFRLCPHPCSRLHRNFLPVFLRLLSTRLRYRNRHSLYLLTTTTPNKMTTSPTLSTKSVSRSCRHLPLPTNPVIHLKYQNTI